MHETHRFLEALALVLGIAAVTTVLFQRLRQPVVLGYLLAGLIVGPHVADPARSPIRTTVQTLSELGVILLMFSLGLEFSLRKLAEVAPTAGVTALIQCSIMLWLGFVIGPGVRLDPLESVFTGAIVAISSTTIIAKAFDEQGIRGRLRELVFGILIVEDLIAILLMAGAHRRLHGERPRRRPHWRRTIGRLLAFLVALVVVGLLVVPRAMRAIVRLERPETTLVASVGICFAIALLAQEFGLSVALGAFLAARWWPSRARSTRSSARRAGDATCSRPIFFVSVGMLIDPALVAKHAAAIVVLTIGGGRRQGRQRHARRVPHRQRHAHLGPGRHEPGADRRVLLHHRRARPLARARRATSSTRSRSRSRRSPRSRRPG